MRLTNAESSNFPSIVNREKRRTEEVIDGVKNIDLIAMYTNGDLYESERAPNTCVKSFSQVMSCGSANCCMLDSRKRKSVFNYKQRLASIGTLAIIVILLSYINVCVGQDDVPHDPEGQNEQELIESCQRTAFLLSFFLGAFGAGRFYIGQVGIPILKLFVMIVNVCGVGITVYKKKFHHRLFFTIFLNGAIVVWWWMDAMNLLLGVIEPEEGWRQFATS